MDRDETWHGGIRLGPGHIASDEDPAPLRKGAQPPIFGHHVYWGQTVAHLSYTAEDL